MFHSVDFTIPANTPKALPATLSVPLTPGTIEQVDVQFPLGCVGLVHTLARRGTHQVWPTNPDGDFASNGMTVSWLDAYDINDAPWSLTLVGWNLDDTYPHTVTWRFALRAFPSEAGRDAIEALYQLALKDEEGAD